MWYWYELVVLGCLTHIIIELVKYLFFDEKQK